VGFLATYQPVLTELQTMGRKSLVPATAFLALSLMIHDYRRLPLRDPGCLQNCCPALAWKAGPCPV